MVCGSTIVNAELAFLPWSTMWTIAPNALPTMGRAICAAVPEWVLCLCDYHNRDPANRQDTHCRYSTIGTCLLVRGVCFVCYGKACFDQNRVSNVRTPLEGRRPVGALNWGSHPGFLGDMKSLRWAFPRRPVAQDIEAFQRLYEDGLAQLLAAANQGPRPEGSWCSA